MELQKIETLLERYMEGETSITEDQVLRDYFKNGQIAPQFEMYTSLFGYFESAKKEQYAGTFNLETTKTRTTLYKTWLAVAASVVLLGTVFWYGNSNKVSQNDLGTYEDPEIALQKTKDILNLVSFYMNEGNDELDYINEIEKTKNKLVKDHK